MYNWFSGKIFGLFGCVLRTVGLFGLFCVTLILYNWFYPLYERLALSFEVAEKNGLPKYVALQPHYNLVERKNYETAYLPLVEKHKLTVFPYWALASGFLTGKYRSEADFGKSVRGSGSQKYLNGNGLAVLEALDKIAHKYQVQQAGVALAWLLAQPHIGAPVASATSKSQLETLFSAPELMLDTEDLELLDRVSR